MPRKNGSKSFYCGRTNAQRRHNKIRWKMYLQRFDDDPIFERGQFVGFMSALRIARKRGRGLPSK